MIFRFHADGGLWEKPVKDFFGVKRWYSKYFGKLSLVEIMADSKLTACQSLQENYDWKGALTLYQRTFAETYERTSIPHDAFNNKPLFEWTTSKPLENSYGAIVHRSRTPIIVDHGNDDDPLVVVDERR